MTTDEYFEVNTKQKGDETGFLYLSLNLNSLGNLIENNIPAEGKFDTCLSIYKISEIPAGFYQYD